MKKIFVYLICFVYSTNTFSQWIHIDPPTSNRTTYINFADNHTGIIQTDNGFLFKTTDGGQQWNSITNHAYAYNYFFSADTSVAYIDSGVGKTNDGGLTWTPACNIMAYIDSNSIPIPFWFSNDHRFGFFAIVHWNFSTADTTYIFKSSDSGAAWSMISTIIDSSFLPPIYSHIMFADSLNGFISLSNSIYKTIDGGINWTFWHSFQNPIAGYHAFSSDTVIVVEESSNIIDKTVDNSQSWQVYNMPVYDIYSIQFISSDVGYACGGNGISSGYVLKSTDGGVNWLTDFHDNNTYNCMSFPSSNSLFVGGDNGTVIKYEEPSDTSHICFVTVDTNSQHNVIFWDNSLLTDVDSIIIFREITTNNYAVIGRIPFGSETSFVDTVQTQYFPNTGNPNSGTYRYKLQFHLSGGGYYIISPYHNTVFIGNNNGTFIWPQLYSVENSPTPVNSYLLMRDDSSNGNWHLVASVTGNQQTITDPQYSAFINTASWRVETQWNLPCASLQPYTTSLSNLYRLSGVGIQDINQNIRVSVFPNPSSDKITIQCPFRIYSIKIFDLQSRLLLTKKYNSAASVSTDLTGFEKGIYFINVETEKGFVVKRIEKS